MLRIISTLITLVVFLGSPWGTFAQQDQVAPKEELPVATTTASEKFVAKTNSPLQCADFFAKDSVKIIMNTPLPQTVPGATIYFTGTIVNFNKTPIINGVIVARVMRKNTDSYEVVDQFVVKDKISLFSKSEHKIEHEWKVPIDIESGEYKLSYFMIAGAYSVVGDLSSGVSSSQTPSFSITSEESPARFIHDSTKTNGNAYTDATAVYEMQGFDPVTITTSITNPTSLQKTVPLQWSQYAWNINVPANQRNVKTQAITLEPGETKEVSYTPVFQVEPSMFVMATLQDVEAKSILNVNLKRREVDNLHFSFVGLSGYPLKAGEEKTVFACLGANNNYPIKDVTLRLKLVKNDGTLIHEYVYDGEVQPDIIGLGGYGESFVPAENVKDFILVSTIERSGRVLDTATTTYNCADLGSSPCEEENFEAMSTIWDWLKSNWTKIVMVTFGVAIIALMVLMSKRRRNTKNLIVDGIEMTNPMQ